MSDTGISLGMQGGVRQIETDGDTIPEDFTVERGRE